MEPRELRIGNYFINVAGISIVNGSIIRWIEEGSYLRSDPIILTEEWLLKFGFVKYNDRWWRYDKNGMFDISNQFDAFCFQTCMWVNDNIKHVHQLQNLYFALTGAELTLKKVE